MGTRTDFEIASFREAAGITPKTGEEEATKLLHAAGVKPATGKRKVLLERIIEVAEGRIIDVIDGTSERGTIDCLKAELSGERSGDGFWHGGYPVRGCIEDLIAACREFLDWERRVDHARRILDEDEREVSEGEELPF